MGSKKMLMRKFGTTIDLTSNLVGHFKLNGNANDEVFANNGSDVGALTYVTGKLGDACSYVASSYNSVPHSDNYIFIDDTTDLPYSFNLWIGVKAVNRTGWLFSKRIGGNQEYLLLATVSGSNVSFVIQNINPSASSNIKFTSVSVPYTVSGFDMLTATYDGSENPNGFSIYFNNVKLSGTPLTTGTYNGMQPLTGTLTIGNEIGAPASRYSSANIDSLSIWKNEALLVDKINALFNSGLGKDYPF